MKGPIPKYPYQPNIKKNIGMIAGGTGLTPMLQVCATQYWYSLHFDLALLHRMLRA